MPKKPIDYSNTHFYKIVCKDTNIKDCYVGHTTDFTNRRYKHKYSCENPNDKRHNFYIYDFIRKNGCWENWTMIEIEKRNCENSLEARRIEREYIEQLNASLNCKKPYSTDEEIRMWKKTSMEEYKEPHKEELETYSIKYREANHELLKEKGRQHYYKNKHTYDQYRKDNAEIIRERGKSYYERNKDKINERSIENTRARAQQLIKCDCGTTIKKPNMWKHKKSQHHQNYEQSLKQNND